MTVGHLGIDIFNSMGPVLVAFLVEPLQLSAAQVGLALGLYQFLAGATQPPFGWVVDRVGSRLLGPLSVLCTMGGLAAAIVVSQRERSFELFLVFFCLAAVGSGAFHPVGTMHASLTSISRSALLTAVFFLFGQIGLSMGPVLGGWSLDRWGTDGVLLILAVFAPLPLMMAWNMSTRALNPLPLEHRAAPVVEEQVESVSTPVLSAFTIILAGRAILHIATAAFLPLLFAQAGQGSTVQGLMVGVYWMGGAITGVVAGSVAARWGSRRVVGATLLAGSASLFLLPDPSSITALFAVVVIGGLLGASHSLLMVMAQEILPVARGLSSGLALGFVFACGALGTAAIGSFADQYELLTVLRYSALLGVPCSFLVLLLPASRRSVPTVNRSEHDEDLRSS